jgi:hypothetical protein
MEPDETLHDRASQTGAARPAATASIAAGADTPQPVGPGPDSAGPGAARPSAARRNFLKAAPLSALAVVAGPAQATQAPPAPAAAAAPKPRGYHETEHIRRYYQTAAYW